MFGPRNITTLAARHNLANIYHSVGRIDDAIALRARVLADGFTVFGPNDPRMLITRSSLAGDYEAAGRLRDAIAMFEQIRSQREKVLGAEHPHTLRSRADLAHAYQAAGQTDLALEMYEKLAPDAERVLGKSSSLTRRINRALTSITSRAETVRERGQRQRVVRSTSFGVQLGSALASIAAAGVGIVASLLSADASWAQGSDRYSGWAAGLAVVLASVTIAVATSILLRRRQSRLLAGVSLDPRLQQIAKALHAATQVEGDEVDQLRVKSGAEVS